MKKFISAECRSEYFLFDKHLTIPVFDSYHSLLFLHRPKGQKNMKEGIHREEICVHDSGCGADDDKRSGFGR